MILELLADGSVNLTTVSLLAPHLTPENHIGLLRAAAHKRKREVEPIVAALTPQPDVAAYVRKLPPPKPVDQPAIDCGVSCTPAERLDPATETGTVPTTTAQPTVVKPLAPERYKIQFTVSRENYDKLRRVQDLLRHQVPTGDVADIFDKALSLLLTAVEKKKLAAVERPRAGSSASARSRHIPASVKREVWQRDGGRCAFVGSEGRCEERGFLEFHHVEPYAAGRAVSVRNLELRCRAHNLFEAERFFGTRNPSLLREPPSEYVVY